MSDIAEKSKLVECALNVLREHGDAVVILFSWTDADGASLISRGAETTTPVSEWRKSSSTKTRQSRVQTN